MTAPTTSGATYGNVSRRRVSGKAKTSERGLGGAWQKLCAQAYDVYGYLCYEDAGGCGKAIDPALPSTHRMSKTVDHLDARAHHGTHLPTIDRVRPMHRACNSAKGDGRTPRETPHAREW